MFSASHARNRVRKAINHNRLPERSLELLVVLAESALELAPKETWSHPAVVADAKRRGVAPERILLDRSLHHAAMSKLTDGFKRGRPDLVHTTMLAVTGSPLYLEGKALLVVHTSADVVLEFRRETRIPKSYARFRSLVEIALSKGEGSELFSVYRARMTELLSRKLRAGRVWGLTTQGKPMKLNELAPDMARFGRPCAVIGGFPHGHFSEDTAKACDMLVRVHERPLEAHVVVSRLLYEVEETIND